MNWCRVIESEGLQFCCRILPGDELPLVEISWATEDGLYAVAVPGSSFSSYEELEVWFSALTPADMLKAQRHFALSRATQPLPPPEDVANALIERAKGGLH